MLQIIKQHKFLLEELVKRDFDKKYRGALLGAAWSIMNPLLTFLIMWAIFGHFFGNFPHYTVYLFCGNVIFSYFSEATSESLVTLVGNAHIFSKVNVPKYLFLLAKNTQTLINFSLTLLVFFLFCFFDGITFSWHFIALIYPLAMLLIFNLGIGFILSALFVFFRDMQYLWGILTQFIMYLSAVFYTIDSFAPNVQKLFYLNPVYLFIRYFRKIVIDGSIPSIEFHVLMAFYAFAVLFLGIWIYKKNDTEFLYYV